MFSGKRPDAVLSTVNGVCSTARRSEVRTRVLTLLDRHSLMMGAYKWTEFDDDFLTKHVESVSVVDIDVQAVSIVLLFTFLFMLVWTCSYF